MELGKLFEATLKSLSEIKINDTVYHGSSISISGDGSVVINGNLETTIESKYINVGIIGNVDQVKTGAGNVTVNGDVLGHVKTMSGDVKTNNIGGDAATMSGDITAKEVKGKVKTMSGDISVK